MYSIYIAQVHFSSVTSADIAISDISLKLDALQWTIYISVAVVASSTTFTYKPNHNGPLKTTEFSEIMKNNSHYAVQSHSRSPTWIPIEMRLPVSD